MTHLAAFASPLDELQIQLDNKYTGKPEIYPALHPRWIENIKFLVYIRLPPDTKDSGTIDEWLERLMFIATDLHWLLQLKHDKFWSQTVFDESLHTLIDSYLRYSPRSHDGMLEISDEAKKRHNEVHRLIFMTCLRQATHKESKGCFITPHVFGEILYENYLFDVPKMMDMCALYAPGNSALLSKMINNIFTQQPKYKDDLRQSIPTILEVFNNIKLSCRLGKGESTNPHKLTNVHLELKSIEMMSFSELQDVVYYLNDIGHTLASFLDVYPAACDIFVEEGFQQSLTSFYDSVVAELYGCLKKRQSEDQGFSILKIKLFGVKKSFLKIFKTIVVHSYLQPILDNSENPEEQVECFIEMITNILSDRRFLADYEGTFGFQSDFEILFQSSVEPDATRINYIRDIINNSFATYGKRKSPTGAKNTGGRLSPEGATGPDNAAMPPTYNPDDIPSAICGALHTTDYFPHEEVCGASASSKQMSKAEMDSLVSSVLDLLPDLGEGFVALCLEEMDYNIERVISAILEEKLPPSMQNIDRKLPKHREDTEDTLLSQRMNVFDNDEFDIFNRDDVDLSKIHLGKKDKVIQCKDQENINAVRNIINQGIEESVDDLYDDEYDDTYDTNDIGADDADSADELTNRRSNVIPKILARVRDQRDDSSEQSSDSDQEGYRRRDLFVEDPAKLRQAQAERYASRQQRRNPRGCQPQQEKKYDVKGQGKGHVQSAEVLKNRKWKESHKSTTTHHNRKVMAAKKQNKGMF